MPDGYVTGSSGISYCNQTPFPPREGKGLGTRLECLLSSAVNNIKSLNPPPPQPPNRPFRFTICGMQLPAHCIWSTFRPHPTPLLRRFQCKFRYILAIAQRVVVPNITIQRISSENLISCLSRASCPVSRWSSYAELQLTIHCMCTSVIKPKEVSQVIYKCLYGT